jgi:hypothetical protein
MRDGKVFRRNEQTSGAVLVSDHCTASVITGNTIQSMRKVEGVRQDREKERRETFMADGAEEVH